MTEEITKEIIEFFDHTILDDKIITNPIFLILDNFNIPLNDAIEFTKTYAPYYKYGNQEMDTKLLSKNPTEETLHEKMNEVNSEIR